MEAGEQQPPPQTEEELRARLEEEMRRVRVQDLLLQSVASILNLSARRIAKEDERDLEQARIGIDAARALVDLLEPEPQRQVREALAELQMLYAQASGAAGAGAGEEKPGQSEAPAAEPAPPSQAESARPASGREPPPKLWTPPGS